MTDRFKVASLGAGAVDWVSMYGESDTRFLRKSWFGGSPWQKGDVGSSAQVMAWAANTAMNLTPTSSRTNCLATVTGKSIQFGGSHGREKATGQELVFVLEELLPDLELEFDKLMYSVIGYGNVGS